jgi:hypothetical protein
VTAFLSIVFPKSRIHLPTAFHPCLKLPLALAQDRFWLSVLLWHACVSPNIT